MWESWTTYGYDEDNLFDRFNSTDFEPAANGQFQLLISLCKLAQKTVNNSVSQLIATNYIDAQLISSILLDKRINTTINEFQRTTPEVFLDTFDLIREMIGANMLMSVYGTNWKFKDVNISEIFRSFFCKSITNIPRLYQLQVLATIPILTCRVSSLPIQTPQAKS